MITRKMLRSILYFEEPIHEPALVEHPEYEWIVKFYDMKRDGYVRVGDMMEEPERRP